MADKPKTGKERREYFRVTDEAVISYRTVDEHEFNRRKNKQPNDVLDSFDLAAKFAEMDREVRRIRQKLLSKNRDIVEYFDLIDTKLNLVAKSALLGTMDNQMQQAREVDLSAGGISYAGPDAVTPGGFVELRIVLLPDYAGLTVGCRVIRCADSQNDDYNCRYSIALEFSDIEEADRDLLIKHLLDRQRAMLRARRDAD